MIERNRHEQLVLLAGMIIGAVLGALFVIGLALLIIPCKVNAEDMEEFRLRSNIDGQVEITCMKDECRLHRVLVDRGMREGVIAFMPKVDNAIAIASFNLRKLGYSEEQANRKVAWIGVDTKTGKVTLRDARNVELQSGISMKFSQRLIIRNKGIIEVVINTSNITLNKEH